MTEERNGVKRMIRKVTEWISLSAVMHYCIFLFLRSSTFRFAYDGPYKRITYILLIGAGMLRLLTGLWTDYRKAGERKERQRVLIRGALALSFLIPLAVVYKQFGYLTVACVPFVAFCLYGIDTEKALKVFTAVIGTMLAATVLSALSGAIRNLLYLREITSGKMRSSYGIGYPTDFASYLVFLLLFAWCAGGRKQRTEQTVLLVILSLGLAYGIYALCDSVTSTVCMGLITVLVVYDRLQARGIFHRRGTGWIEKTIDFLAIWAFPIFGAVMLGLTWLYGQGNAFAIQANEWMSERLAQAWNAFQTHGIHAFGAWVVQTGQGKSVIFDAVSRDFLDSTYVLVLIRYGWVIFLMTGALWVWMTRRAIRTGRRKIALAMAVIAFHSFAEHHFPEVNYNLLLVLPLCSLPAFQEEKVADGPAGQRAKRSGKQLAGWISLGFTGLVFGLLLPRLLSQARCLFAMKGWQDLAAWTYTGERSLGALLFWVALLGVFAGFGFVLWRGMTAILEKGRISRRTWAGLAAVICAAAAGGIWAGGQVRAERPQAEARIEAEAGPVETVLAAAAEPVYAGETEALYRKRFPAIRGRIFTAEELGRTGHGSILLEQGNEGYQLLNTGAVYTELTPTTGLFTYDPAVITALSEKGYTFLPWYSTEREEDLKYFAVVNKVPVTEDGGVLLEGRKHPMKHGPYLDQSGGEYRVTYTLALENLKLAGKDRDVCTLRVTEKSGENILAERTVKGTEFDAEGRLTVSLDYTVGNTHDVEFRAYPRKSYHIRLERIAWKRK